MVGFTITNSLMKIINFIFTAEVEAIEDLWLIGDSFLRTSYSSLQEMRTDAKVNKITGPYIYDYYNIKAYFQASNGSSSAALFNILNSVIEGLNDKTHLPRYILICPDRDLLQHANHFLFGIHIILEKIVPWLVKEIEKMLKIRKEGLKDHLLGATGPDTKLIWVSMIERPLINHHPSKIYNNTVNLRRKFNSTLQNELAITKNSFYIETEGIFDSYTDYDHFGNLTSEGKKHFWKYVDTSIKKFEKGESRLLPYRKLPAPPPTKAYCAQNTKRRY